MKRTLPGPLTILMMVIVFAAVGTWILPAGQYDKLSVSGNNFLLKNPGKEIILPYKQSTLDSLGLHIAIEKFINGDLRKPVSVPGSFKKLEKSPQGLIDVLQAPIKGIYDSIDIILFILTIGGFMFVFAETGAIVKGITWLSHRMSTKIPLLIIILTSVFSFCAASYGMGEEALVFYPLLVPLFLAAGYDMMVPLAIIFGGTSLGSVPAFSNPFSTIIAANAAGFNWMDGLYARLIVWVITTGLLSVYILRYAAKVKQDPAKSIVLMYDGIVTPNFQFEIPAQTVTPKLDARTKLLLLIYLLSFVVMIVGVVAFDWWTLEMSSLFLGAAILVGIITRMKEKIFVSEFIRGAESLLNVAFIVGVARGVTVILDNGHISDSILFYAANLVQGLNPAIFILLLMIFYFLFGIFINSSSGMAVLTMPIIGALAIVVNIPGREVVNAYQYGIGIISFLTPTGLVLPSLALLNISFKAWMKFIMPFLLMLIVICTISLLIGVYYK